MKRKNGMGTLYLRKDGRYEAAKLARFSDGRRKRISGYGSTPTMALQKLNDRLAQIEAAKASEPEKILRAAAHPTLIAMAEYLSLNTTVVDALYV